MPQNNSIISVHLAAPRYDSISQPLPYTYAIPDSHAKLWPETVSYQGGNTTLWNELSLKQYYIPI
jgi:hypothetical protein